METDIFQQEMAGDGEFMNADGVLDSTIAPTLAPNVSAPTASSAAPVAVDKATRHANAVAHNQEMLAKLGAWSTKNAANIGRLNTDIERIKSVVSQREAELVGLGGADVNSPNNKIKRLSLALAHAKAELSQREAKLAKVLENKAKLEKYQANQTARTAKLAGMSSADGADSDDDDDFYSADGTKSSKIDTKYLVIGIAIGVGFMLLARKYKFFGSKI